MRHAGEIIKNIIVELNGDDTLKDVITMRKKIFDNSYFSHIDIIDILNNELIISVDHPGWVQYIKLDEKNILKKIKKEFPEIGVKRLKVIICNKKPS